MTDLMDQSADAPMETPCRLDLEAGLGRKERHGMRGGATPRERYQLWKEARRG